MSQYRECRRCGDDLGSTGRGFGWNECCCDSGYCTSCGLDDACLDAPPSSDGRAGEG